MKFKLRDGLLRSKYNGEAYEAEKYYRALDDKIKTDV